MTTALKIPPSNPGMPCRLLIPQVSFNPIFYSRKDVSFIKQKVEIIPPKNPIVKLAAGLTARPLTAPIMTPPANVAFKISSMCNFSLKIALTIKVPIQLPVNERTVLLMIRDLSKLVYGKNPALNEGQNIHKKRVPIIAIVELAYDPSGDLVGLTLQAKIRLTVNPKYAPKVWIAVLPPTSRACKTS